MPEKQEKKKNIWMFSTISLAIVLAVFAAASSLACTGMATSKELSADEISNKTIEFLNTYLVQPSVTSSFVSIEDVGSLYRVTTLIENQEVPVYVSGDRKYIFLPRGTIDVAEFEAATTTTATQEQPQITVGSFNVVDIPVCEENGKPIIYFFGSSGCPHCRWEHPIIEEVAEQFDDYISFHNNMDGDEDLDVFYTYSTGGVPTTVLGCKYFRQGSGESLGEDMEKEALTAIICKLTGNQPDDVCSPLADVIEEIPY